MDKNERLKIIIVYNVTKTVAQKSTQSLNIQRISEKNVTNLILNNFNKLKPISIIFAHSISRMF